MRIEIVEIVRAGKKGADGSFFTFQRGIKKNSGQQELFALAVHHPRSINVARTISN